RRTDHPVCAASVASRLLFTGAASPPFQGGENVIVIASRSIKLAPIWREPGLQDRRRRLRRCEEADQRFGGLQLPGHAGERPREGNVRLKLGRNRAHESNTRDVEQLADLLKTNLRLAARDDRSYRFAGRRPAHLLSLARQLAC